MTSVSASGRPATRNICSTSYATHTRATPTTDQPGGMDVRVRVEIRGSQTCRIVGRSQSVLIMIDPIIFTRTRRFECMQCTHTDIMHQVQVCCRIQCIPPKSAHLHGSPQRWLGIHVCQHHTSPGEAACELVTITPETSQT
jgi:hypothetical protein